MRSNTPPDRTDVAISAFPPPMDPREAWHTEITFLVTRMRTMKDDIESGQVTELSSTILSARLNLLEEAVLLILSKPY